MRSALTGTVRLLVDPEDSFEGISTRTNLFKYIHDGLCDVSVVERSACGHEAQEASQKLQANQKPAKARMDECGLLARKSMRTRREERRYARSACA